MQLEDASTHRLTFVDYATLSNNRCVSDQLRALRAYILPRYRRLNAGVEHALFEQLALFSNASIVLEE